MKVSFQIIARLAVLLGSVTGAFGCEGKVGDTGPEQRAIVRPGATGQGTGAMGGSGSAAQDPGRVLMHRLNVAEYDNTVRDLFGTSVRLPDSFPPDDTAYGFDNVAEALNLTDVHLGHYMATAKAIASDALSAGRRQKLVACDLAAQQEVCVRAVLRTFLPRAWRRPVDDEEVNGLTALFTSSKADSATDDEAIARVIQAVLVSPQFLFRLELNATSPASTPRPLDDYELAARLSYFLWSSMPDDELFRAASAKELGDSANLSAQVARMVSDPKAKAIVDNFGAEWLYTRNLANVQPDKTVYTSFDDDLRAAMANETTSLFGDIARGTSAVEELLTSSFSYLNDRLAKHYGLPAVGSATPVRTQVPGQRGGLLTHASMLAVNAHPKETAPVLRGKWILSQLLCTDIPPPPPDIPMEPAAMANQSRRQRLAAHRQSSVCSSCHSLMDPLGLALEQYDPVGAFRTTDNGVAIDTSGQLPDGKTFAGPRELGSMIASNPDFLRCVAEHAFTYGLGRAKRVGSADDKLIDDVTTTFSAQGHKFPALVEAMILSDAFRTRQDDPRTAADVQGGAP